MAVSRMFVITKLRGLIEIKQKRILNETVWHYSQNKWNQNNKIQIGKHQQLMLKQDFTVVWTQDQNYETQYLTLYCRNNNGKLDYNKLCYFKILIIGSDKPTTNTQGLEFPDEVAVV